MLLVCCMRQAAQLGQKESMSYREVEFPPRITPAGDKTSTPPGHMKPFGYQRAPDGPVTEYKEVLHPEEFWNKHVLREEPLVFRQAIKDSPAISKWTDSYLREKYGDLDVLIELKKEDRAHSAKRMNISTFLDRYNTEDVYAVTVLPNPMREEVQTPKCLLCGSFVDFLHELNFWMSSGGTRSVIHYDADHNIHCLIAGRKDFMMINKKGNEGYLYMVEKDQFAGSRFSVVNPDKINLFEYPNISEVRWTFATISAGDCIYIPAEYIHQVRSYNRSISVTMLFTENPDGTFTRRGCDEATFEYTPLSKVRVHWTYNKGDSVIEMGYMNVEMLRMSVVHSFEQFKTDKLTEDLFVKFWHQVVTSEEEQEDPRLVFRSLIDREGKGHVTREDLMQLPQENLKNLARAMDPPHGPEHSSKLPGDEREGDQDEDVQDSEEQKEDALQSSKKDEL